MICRQLEPIDRNEIKRFIGRYRDNNGWHDSPVALTPYRHSGADVLDVDVSVGRCDQRARRYAL
jgi:hypothetical protein